MTTPEINSPLSTWFPDPRALARFRRRQLGRAPVVLPPHDDAWRAIAPDFETTVAMAAGGLPFQIVAERRYDRSPDRRRLGRALVTGATVLLPQAHQVLPRLTRLMVALRVAFLGPFREECSFLFAVGGTGRPGMGLHHDGDVDAFWLQIEGRRTLTLGPPVRQGTPEDLDDRLAVGAGWRTRNLEPGTLLYLPPYRPHRVVCHGRSVALTLTWRASRRRLLATGTRVTRLTRAQAAALTAWDVVSGHADAIPRPSPDRLWVQVPVVTGPADGSGRVLTLWTPDAAVRVPGRLRRLASHFAVMPSFSRPAGGVSEADLAPLVRQGLLAPRDLPFRIIPEKPGELDGWRFA